MLERVHVHKRRCFFLAPLIAAEMMVWAGPALPQGGTQKQAQTPAETKKVRVQQRNEGSAHYRVFRNERARCLLLLAQSSGRLLAVEAEAVGCMLLAVDNNRDW